MAKAKQQRITSVMMLSREYGELAGAGGVKDVVAQLSQALARWTARTVHVVLPCYGFMNPVTLGFTRLPDPLHPDRPLEFSVAMNYTSVERQERVRIWHGVHNRVRLYLVEAERYLEKHGVYTYTREESQREPWKIQGSGHFDYFAMNILLQKAGLELMIILDERPNIVHCHDGHTAVAPALMRECPGYRQYFRGTAAVVTIHNAGIGYHQEVSDLAFAQAVTGLPWRVINDGLNEHSFDPFIAAARYASVSTVSENYARELQETDDDYLTGWLGHRLADRGVTIVGITNGIDPRDYDPALPESAGIAAGYEVDDETGELAGKLRCKSTLLERYAAAPDAEDETRYGFLTVDTAMSLFTFIGRLSQQKGVDILAGAAELFLELENGAQIICLGSGGALEEAFLIRLANHPAYRGRFCYVPGYDPALAKKLYAAGDFFIIPSRYEPCGLTDYIAQLFGTVPVVHHVGGLVKVVDGETGFTYRDNTPENLAEAMRRAQRMFGEPDRLRRMQRAAVRKIHRQHTWNQVMKDYVGLYKQSRTGQVGGII